MSGGGFFPEANYKENRSRLVSAGVYYRLINQEEIMNIRDQRQTVVVQDSDEQIRKQAYYLWQQDGCPDGRALDHWLAAQEIVRRRHGEVARVRLRHREKVPLLNLAAVAEVL